MDKLVNLFNEYRRTVHGYSVPEWEEKELGLPDYYIISREFGFIEWLLKNQKISPSKLDKALSDCAYINDILAGSWIKLTMFLSIKDKPIKFLASILK